MRSKLPIAFMPKAHAPLIFYFIFFCLPFVFTLKTSELFEFNKMVLIYLTTTLILFFWALTCIQARKFVFRRTLLDIPIIIFLIVQSLSTLFSIDFRTSLLGYYGRFNGGLLSSISYAVLYWAFVTFMDSERTKKVLLIILVSGLLVSAWGILEHFGVSISCLLLRGQLNVSCWQEDVQNRVFATLGQPNWLAAFLVVLIPLAWNKILSIKHSLPNTKFIFWNVISLLFFATLLFTKSRSGILGFLVSYFIFWGLSRRFKPFLLSSTYLLLAAVLIGTPWTPNINQILSTNAPAQKVTEMSPKGPALETGGTESGEIRKIVWSGAIDIWINYPILGTGPETFAFSYFKFRPVEHNLTSEWDFLYNKAHNEFLNYAATSGTLGLLSYLLLIIASLYQIKKSTNIALAAGFVGLLVTNFFGFSVVLTSFLFFLIPAIAATGSSLKPKTESLKLHRGLTILQKLGFFLALSIMLHALFLLGKYWYADTLYAQGRSLNDEGNFVSSQEVLNRAVELSPNEPLFWLELSESTKSSAVKLSENGDSLAADVASKADYQAEIASEKSPASVSIKRAKSIYYTDLAEVDTGYLLKARDELVSALTLAPTDAKLYYSLGLNYYRIGQTQDAVKAFTTSINLKPNYTNAIQALELVNKSNKTIPK